MRARTRPLATVVLLLLLLAVSATVRGQEAAGVHVSAGVLADVKRFSGNPDDDLLRGETAGGTFAVGARVSDRWELSLDVDLPRSTKVIEERSIVLRAVRVDVQTITSNRPIGVSAMARFQPSGTGRVRLGYLAGVSFIGLRQRFETNAPGVSPSLVPDPQTTVDYSAAPAAGIDALIPLTRHLAVVPAFVATIFRGTEQSGLLLRPRVSARWTF